MFGFLHIANVYNPYLIEGAKLHKFLTHTVSDMGCCQNSFVMHREKEGMTRIIFQTASLFLIYQPDKKSVKLSTFR